MKLGDFTLTFCAALVGGAGLLWATDGLNAFTAEGARRLNVANTQPHVPNMLVETMSGDFKTLTTNTGEVTLVEFIYTTCADICQSSGGEFAELRDLIVRKDLSVRMMSISFDPEVDDINALLNYADLHNAFDKAWTIVRPQVSDLKDMLDFFQVTVIPDNWGGYQHNTAVLLISPDGQFSGVFNTNAYQEIIQAVKTSLS